MAACFSALVASAASTRWADPSPATTPIPITAVTIQFFMTPLFLEIERRERQALWPVAQGCTRRQGGGKAPERAPPFQEQSPGRQPGNAGIARHRFGQSPGHRGLISAMTSHRADRRGFRGTSPRGPWRGDQVRLWALRRVEYHLCVSAECSAAIAGNREGRESLPLLRS